MAKLIEKEKAIDDVVAGFKRGGLRLIQEFEKARNKEVEDFQRRTDEMKKKKSERLKEELAWLDQEMKYVDSFDFDEMGKEWEEEQKTIWAKVDVALAAGAM